MRGLAAVLALAVLGATGGVHWTRPKERQVGGGLSTAIAALALAAVLLVPGASSAQVPTGDSVSGSGTARNSETGQLVWSFHFSASSGPSGEQPTGRVSVIFQGFQQVGGRVSCLAVRGSRAVIGVEVELSVPNRTDGLYVTVVDGGPAGSGLDTFDAVPTLNNIPTDCSIDPPSFAPGPVDSGDILVFDAPPLPTFKGQCKNGGWRTFGVFKNEGDCVSFVATGGKNQPAR